MSSSLPNSAKVRDGRLDVLRGLCLLNMIVVHLYDQGMGGPAWLHDLVVHWFRFAAGGFIVTSGMCIGAIHYQRALDPTRRLGTYRSLVQRAGLVLLVHYFSVFLSLMVIPAAGEPVHNVSRMVTDALRFYTGYELLLFYVVMLLAAPLMVEITRRFGALTMLAVSVAIFCVKYQHPYLSLYAIENHFPLLRWQLVFVAGVIGGSMLPKFDAMPATAKFKMLAAGAALSLCIAGYAAVLRDGGYVVPAVLDVTKLPLSPLEVLRYAALTLTIGLAVDRLYPRLAGLALEKFLRTIGAQSLLLWVAHIYITAQFVAMRWPVAIALSLGVAWIVARLGLLVAQAWNARATALPRIGYVSPVLGSLLAIAILRGVETPVELAQPALPTPSENRPAEITLTLTSDTIFDDDISPDSPPPLLLDDDPLDNTA